MILISCSLVDLIVEKDSSIKLVMIFEQEYRMYAKTDTMLQKLCTNEQGN